MDRILFTLLRQVWLSVNQFSRNSRLPDNILYKYNTEFKENPISGLVTDATSQTYGEDLVST